MGSCARSVSAIAGLFCAAIVLSAPVLAQPQELPKGLAPSGSSVPTQPNSDISKPVAPAPTLPDGTLAVPALARVTDTAGVLDGAARSQLEAKLAAFEQARGAQIAVIIVPSTQPEPISDFANRVGGGGGRRGRALGGGGPIFLPGGWTGGGSGGGWSGGGGGWSSGGGGDFSGGGGGSSW
jgi:hypothetical protein